MDQLVGVIWDATKYLCGCTKQQADYVYDLEENLRTLEDKWQNLKDMKEDVRRDLEEAENTGAMRRSQQVNSWLQRIEAIQRGIEDIIVHGAPEIQNKCLCECCPKNCVSSYKLGKHVAKMLKNVDELVTTGKSFNKNAEIAHKLPHRSVEMPLDETAGLDLMLERVWNSIEDENVSVIGLYGMGGAGKTTLLKRINNEFENKTPNFDIVMWVVVSKELSFDSIMDNIRKKIGIRNDIWHDCSTQDEKAAKIYQVLKQKNFVLLLDDIWERVDLKMVGIPNPKDTKFHSKVLFTTRSEDVCAKMQAQRKFKVECLTEKEAFELFCMKVGEESLKSHPHIPKLAREMAAECKGLPLALIVVGSAMAGVKSLEAWEHSKNNLTSSSWTASDLETKVFSILKFSYDQLPDQSHKNCFLYCALYPEDYEIHVPTLIDKWMGEGFLGENPTKSISDIRCHGESVVEKLKLSCLLETVEDEVFLNRTVKMHDVIRDMALWLARDQNKNKKKILLDAFAISQDDVETWKIVEKISITRFNEFYAPPVDCPNLISLMILPTECREITVDLPNIQYMSRLKVLHLSCPSIVIELPAEIGELFRLEYLSLRGQMYASEFPIELKNLRNLKYFALHISGGDLVCIPLEVISCLEQLRVLRFTSTLKTKSGEEREFLENLESLLKLEEIWIRIRTKNGLMKLLESSRLQSCVWVLDLAELDTPINMPLLLASMSKMKQLQKILFTRLNFVEDFSVFDTCCLRMLRQVYISQCHSVVHVTWLKYAPLLQGLQISQCDSIEEMIKGRSENDKSRENVDNIFSSLVDLHLLRLPKLKSIYKIALCFPSLRSIEISGCPNLKKLPFDSNSAKDKLRHIEGSQEWWDNLELEDPESKEKFQSKFRAR